MTETYRVDIKCFNCKANNWNVQIPRGMSLEEFGDQSNVKCERCGCFAIKVKQKKETKVKIKEEKKSNKGEKNAD
jgi:Zn finger protein HypA/HybF involved in hydrogenase expression